MRKGVDLGRGCSVLGDTAETGKGVDTVNVHGARAANSLTARATESECGVLLVLDLDEGIEHHWSTLVEVDLVCLELGLLRWCVGVLRC